MGSKNTSKKDITEDSSNEFIMLEGVHELAKSIDCTLLKPDATEADVKKLCQQAKKYGFATVVINPCFVRSASSLLKNTTVRVGTVVGFPLGANTTTEKCFETINNIVNGATEIDFVMNIGYLKARQYDDLFRDIKAVVVAAKRGELKRPNTTIITKVIIEACCLTEDEKHIACKIAEKAGVDFVKTSTGFLNGGGAKEKDVRLLRRLLPSTIGIKAAGGINTLAEANGYIEIGASRIGTSNGIEIVKEYLAVTKKKPAIDKRKTKKESKRKKK